MLSASNSVELGPAPLDRFDLADPALFLQKLAALCEGSNFPEVYLDWDYTMTGESTWRRVSHILPQPGRAESKSSRIANMALERKGLLTDEQHREWSLAELERYVTYGLEIAAMQLEMKRTAMRPGATSLMRFCGHVGVEPLIVSSSIKPAIETVLAYHAVRASVIANELQVEDGIVVGFDDTDIVHSGNKREHIARVRRPNEQEWSFVLGDNVHDAGMVLGGNAIRIRVPREGSNTQDFLEESFNADPAFDAVLRGKGMWAVVGLFEWVEASRRLRS